MAFGFESESLCFTSSVQRHKDGLCLREEGSDEGEERSRKKPETNVETVISAVCL